MGILLERIKKMEDNLQLTIEPFAGFADEMEHYGVIFESILLRIVALKQCFSGYRFINGTALLENDKAAEDFIASGFIFAIEGLLTSIVNGCDNALRQIEDNPGWNIPVKDIQFLQKNKKAYSEIHKILHDVFEKHKNGILSLNQADGTTHI